MKKLPGEVVASLLAVSTIIIALPPLNLPPWAIFITWAGTYAMGGPTPRNLRRIWPVLPLGAFFAFLIVLGFMLASRFFTGTAFIIAQMVVLFCLNATMMLCARFPLFGFVPGMFFGFASYFATMFGGFGPVPHNPVSALVAVILMNALGPVYAWLKDRYSAPERENERHREPLEPLPERKPGAVH